jgi:hypothetical protein
VGDLRTIIAKRIADAEARGATKVHRDRVVQHDHGAIGSVTYANCIGCIADARDAVEDDLAEARAEVARLSDELAARERGAKEVAIASLERVESRIEHVRPHAYKLDGYAAHDVDLTIVRGELAALRAGAAAKEAGS